MEPSYYEGDRVLTFNFSKLKKNDVVVFRFSGQFHLKRIIRIENGLFYVDGDNKYVSTKYRPIKRELIIGKVVFKY